MPDIEAERTLRQGIYGQLLNGCDTPDCKVSAAEGVTVYLFVTRPIAETQAFAARAASNERGLFQLATDPGTYSLCRGFYNDQPTVMRYSFGPCVDVTVPSGAVRRDWASGPGGGRWSGGENYGPSDAP